MKQKRKVKSLISSNGENKNLLTALLFLVGGVLFCGALALFASIGGVASAENSDVIEYPGIDDKKEVLLRFGLIPEGGTEAVNEMFLTGKAFYVNGNAGLSVDGASDMALGAGKYINFLGGKTDGSNIDSNNVTIIGGNQVKIMENNDNTTFLGGSSNTVNQGYSESVSVSPVMLGGQSNTIGSNQEGSAIIGGRNNEIGGSTSYDFVIGGENNNIGSNSKNAIVGGARVIVNGGNSNLFAFSAGSEFNPKGGNAFYLNVQHGLGLNKAASDLSENNLGIDSNGAVSFGPIDITSSARKCTSDDYGVQGSFEGCLVGCTKLGADNGGKWEMVDHGDKCKRLCEDVYSAYCIMSPIEPAKPDPYTSYCTTNGVDTGHSHHCGGEALVLPNYQNVLFETKLIDSDDSCPKPGTANWTENRCVFKCDGEYHLTGDQTGMGGRTKCYKDCKLPWDGTKIKHNETRIAYNTDETYCAFPSGSPASPHTCANHKKTIICQNGTLYLQKSNGQADTAHPAITDGYVYSGCMLNQYRCNTDVYNYSASDITSSSKFNDTVATWNLTDRGTTNGTRGVYRLCIDYNTNPNIVQQLNGEKCDALNLNSSVSPKRYTTHYQWVGCRPNYHTGAGYETVCMKDCTLKKTNNQVQYYRHNTTVVGYKTKQETCTDKCESATLVCNDGKWRLGSLNGTQTTAYVYNDCTLKDYTCASRYNVTETEKQAHESTSIYGNSCVPYKANNTDKVTCTAQSTKYELTDCKSGYHTVNGKRCVSNYKEVNCNTTSVWKPDNAHFNVVSVGVYWKSSCGRKGSDATCWESPVDCGWDCDTNYHQEGSNLCCHDGEHSEDGSCTSNTSTAPCTQAGKPDYSDYIIENVGITYNESNGTWSTPANCRWTCWEGYSPNGNKCDKDPDPVNGNCGTDPEHYYCVAGTPDDETSTDDKYTWTCKGLNGGGHDYCSEPRKRDGQCLNNSHYNCIVGNPENGQENDSGWTWTCKGINGGKSDSCSEQKDTTATVKFIVNNIGTVSIYVAEVDIGERGQHDWVSSYGCVPENNSSETVVWVGQNESLTINCTANFVAGQKYYPRLVYDSNLGQNPSGTQEYSAGYIIPRAGENTYEFNVVGPNNIQTIYHNYKIYRSPIVETDTHLSYILDIENMKTNTRENLPVNVDFSASYKWLWNGTQRDGGGSFSLSSLEGNAGHYEGGGVVIDGHAFNGISNINLAFDNGTSSTSVTNGYDVYNVYLEKASDLTPRCGGAHLSSSLDAPTSNLCIVGAASNPVYGTAGNGSPAWTWKCGDGNDRINCWSYIPTHEFDCVGIDNSSFNPAVEFNAYDRVYDGVVMNVYMVYNCINPGSAVQLEGTFPITYYQSDRTWKNPSMFSEMQSCYEVDVLYAEIKSFNPVNKNGYMLMPRLSCSTSPVNGNCGTNPEHFECVAGTPDDETTLEDRYTWTCKGLNGGGHDYCTELIKKDGQCLNNSHYNCIVGEPIQTGAVEGSTQYTWKCKGVNNGNTSPLCTESCPTGQVIQNGVCADDDDYVRVCAGECNDGGTTPGVDCGNLTQTQCQRTSGCAWNTPNQYCYESGPSQSYDCLGKTKNQCTSISDCSWSEGILCVKDTTYCKKQAETSRDLTADCVDTTTSKCSGSAPACGNSIPVDPEEEPSCGPASTYMNGYFIVPPDSDLCSVGEVGDSPRHYPVTSPTWTWTCELGNQTKNCTARFALGGSCGEYENTCDAGSKQDYDSTTHTWSCVAGYGGTAYCGCNTLGCPYGYTFDASDSKCHLTAKACLRYKFYIPPANDGRGAAGTLGIYSPCGDGGNVNDQHVLANYLPSGAFWCVTDCSQGINLYNNGGCDSCYEFADSYYDEDDHESAGTVMCDKGVFGGRNPSGSDTIPSGCSLMNVGDIHDGVYQYTCGSNNVIDPCDGAGGGVCNVVTLSRGL